MTDNGESTISLYLPCYWYTEDPDADMLCDKCPVMCYTRNSLVSFYIYCIYNVIFWQYFNGRTKLIVILYKCMIFKISLLMSLIAVYVAWAVQSEWCCLQWHPVWVDSVYLAFHDLHGPCGPCSGLQIAIRPRVLTADLGAGGHNRTNQWHPRDSFHIETLMHGQNGNHSPKIVSN